MKKILEKMKEKRLQFEKWLEKNHDILFMRVVRVVSLFVSFLLIVFCVIVPNCKNKKTALAETVSNGFNIQLPTLVSSFSSVSTVDTLPMYAYSYNTAYNVKINCLTSPTGTSHIYFTTTGGSDGNDVFSPSFRILDNQTTYSYYVTYGSTSPHVNSLLYYADGLYSSIFPNIRPLELTLSCVDISYVTNKFPEITVSRYSSPYSLSTLSFYRVALRGDYGDNDNKTWYIVIFCPIQIEDYALFNNHSSISVDLSNNKVNQYQLGYQAGLSASQTDAFQRGYDNGKAVGDQEGYARGLEEQLSNVSPLRVVFNSISDILKIEIVPYVKLGYLLTLVIGVLAISLVFRRGD